MPTSQPTTIQMLRHVDNVRKTSLPKKNLFTQDSIIACLVHVQQTCGEQCRSRFTDLFAIAYESEDEVLLRDIRSTRKRNKQNNRMMTSERTSHKRDSEQSNSTSSSDDEDFKRKRRQKRRPKESSESD